MSEDNQHVPSLFESFKAPAAQSGLKLFSKSSRRNSRNSLRLQGGCSSERHCLARIRGSRAVRHHTV